MQDLIPDFETVSPDDWIINEEEWKQKLIKLPNWLRVI